MNFLGVLGFNCESLLFDIKNLNEFEFGKSLFKIRNFYSQEEHDIELLNYVINISDFAQDIAEALNIYLLYLPEYSPWFDPVESVWDIHKKYIKGLLIESKEMLIDETLYIFNEKCRGDSLQKNFKEKYMTSIC